MHDSELAQYVAYSGFLYRAVSDDLGRLISTIKESSAGYPTGHEGKTELDDDGEAVTYDSRTQSAALHPDPARDARRELERNVKALRSALVNLDGLRQAWLVTTLDRPVGEREEGCSSCARAKIWSPRRILPPMTSRPDPGIPEKAGTPSPPEPARYDKLCQWCSDWNRAEGQYPPLNVLEAHHQGRRITNGLLGKLGVKTKGSARDRRKAS